MKIKCAICDSKSERRIPVVSNIIIDSNSNIQDVIFGDSLEVCGNCYRRFGPYRKGRNKKSYKWIEKLLKTPYSDGRHRITDLVLMPYLANVKNLSKKRAINKIREWFKICNYSKLTKSYLEKQFGYVKRRKLNPLSKEKFDERGWNKFKKKVMSYA